MTQSSASTSFGEGGESDTEVQADGKSPLKGFRPKPEWVPTLEIRLAMVKSPRKPKGGLNKQPSMAKQPSINQAMAKQQADAKKAVAKMGGNNAFAPKPGAAGAAGKPKAAAKPKAAGGAKANAAPVKV